VTPSSGLYAQKELAASVFMVSAQWSNQCFILGFLKMEMLGSSGTWVRICQTARLCSRGNRSELHSGSDLGRRVDCLDRYFVVFLMPSFQVPL
jgi:hypothetical protein